MTERFNLSEWALRERSLVWYFILVSAIAGAFTYVNLGREEDPSFSIKTMLIQAQWPGASIEDTLSQVTERIERKLEELESLDYTKSMTTPGQTTVYVNLKNSTDAAAVPATWVQVRNMINDIRSQFPEGVVGPAFNDRFGDVFGNIYAFTADGLTQRQLHDYVEAVRAKVLTVPNAGRVELIGAQDEVIFLEFSTRQLAALGIDQQDVIATLRSQNAISPSGVMQAGPERISLRVGGQFSSEASLQGINLRVNDRFFRLSDVATISRGYTDPPKALFRYKGEPAIGLAIGMKAGANLLEFGEALHAEMDEIIGELPVGVGVHLVSDQPVVVEEAVGHFTRALFEAVAIVLVVSFVSLGLRAGLVVALNIPLVLAITFVVMQLTGISMQRISLGALIISLGLLVDDAMIAVEMMVARLEVGDTLTKAATHVYTSTAFPMLTGTLVTVASFIPVGLNDSAAGEYTFTLFVVIAAALLISWIVAVIGAPLLGVTLLPATMKSHGAGPGRLRPRLRRAARRSHALALGDHRRHGGALRGVALRHALRRAAVFSQLGPARTGRRRHPAAERLDRRDPGANGPLRGGAGRRPRHRPLVVLRRPGRDPLRAGLRRAGGQPQHRPNHHREQGPQGARPRPGAAEAGRARAVRRDRHPGQPAAARAAGGPAGAVPRQRAGHPEGARGGARPRHHHRQPSPAHRHRLRLDRAGARRQGGGAAGQGPPARRDVRGHRRRAEWHRRRRQHHSGARTRSTSSTSWRGRGRPNGNRSTRC